MRAMGSVVSPLQCDRVTVMYGWKRARKTPEGLGAQEKDRHNIETATMRVKR